MSKHQPYPYWISTDEREYQKQSLLDQEIEMRHKPSSLSTPSTDRGSNIDEHRDTTISSLLTQEDGTLGSEFSIGSTAVGNAAQHTRDNNVPDASPLGQEKSLRMMPGWPLSPKSINTPIYVKVLNGIFDILLLACSATFLAFAIVIDVHDQVPTADYPRLTTVLIRATKYGPTVFPILFASIVGRAVHAILLWRLEKGERIGILDTLASSTSLTSTVTSQIQLRSFSILGVALLAVWLLSPIGGQASVRVLSIRSKDTGIHDSSWYMVNSGYLGAYSPKVTAIQGGSMAGAVFVAALMGSPETKSSLLDLWGNVKVPRIEGYEQVATMKYDGWYEIEGSDSDTYSSLVGIPILGTNQSNFIDYITRIHSPYFHLQCSIKTTVSDTDWFMDKVLPGLTSNASSPGSWLFWDIPDSSLDENPSREGWRETILPELVSPLKLKYVPLYSSNFTLTCDMTQSYVETEIRCPTSSTCAARRIRRSTLDHFPAPWTYLDISWQSPRLLFQGILNSIARGSNHYPQLFDRYLTDPDLSNSNFANLSPTTEEQYTIRLGQMLNTYFSCLSGFFAITAGINNDTAYYWDSNQTFELSPNVNNSWQDLYDAPMFGNIESNIFKAEAWTSEITKTERKEVIVAHRAWVIALFLASIVIIVASLVAPFVRHFLTTGVDVAMNISSLATRTNPYISVPQTGTYLDASDRARLLYNHQIRLGDAKSGTDVGSIVMGSFDRVGDLGIARVRKRRAYQ